MSAIGLYGGTFDPVHHGHGIVARSVREQLHLDEVIFVPSAQPPHKDPGGVTAFEHRAAMVELALRDEPGFGVDRCEGQRQGPSYTLQTIEHYRRQLGPETELVWIIGADSLEELDTWHRVDRLVQACRIVTVGRPGWSAPDLSALQSAIGLQGVQCLRDDVLTAPLIEIASRDIRRRVADGQSIRYLVSDAVAQYIQRHGLYQGH